MEILEKVETKGAFSNLLLNQTIKKGNLEPNDSGLLTELVYGVMQRKYALDYQLSPYIKNPSKLDNWVRQLLRLSLYQLEYLDRIPDHAVLNEAVTIAKIRGHKGISGLVNGVLRNIQRNGVPAFDKITDFKERIATQYSLPDWMVEEFIEEIGLDETEKLAQSFLEKSEVSIRVNTKLITVEEAIARLTEEGFEVSKSALSPVGLISKNGLPAHSELFKEGAITIQDESSMLVAPALEVTPEDKVLDACAAPGGKTTHIASYLSAKLDGQIIALDLHQHKVRLIDENATRQQVSNVVKTQTLDAKEAEETFGTEVFDRVLVDAPCSGLGLMRRKPDIRYTKTPEDIKNLQKVQLDILNSVAGTLKKEGQLVYSTCTITKEENEQVVDRFIKEHPNFERIPVYLEKETAKRSRDGSVTIYPHQYGTDGFFICSLRKKTK